MNTNPPPPREINDVMCMPLSIERTRKLIGRDASICSECPVIRTGGDCRRYCGESMKDHVWVPAVKIITARLEGTV